MLEMVDWVRGVARGRLENLNKYLGGNSQDLRQDGMWLGGREEQ